jgi:hypothetical protein
VTPWSGEPAGESSSRPRAHLSEAAGLTRRSASRRPTAGREARKSPCQHVDHKYQASVPADRRANEIARSWVTCPPPAAAFKSGRHTTSAQNSVIWTAEAMNDVDPVFVQLGGSGRVLADLSVAYRDAGANGRVADADPDGEFWASHGAPPWVVRITVQVGLAALEPEWQRRCGCVSDGRSGRRAQAPVARTEPPDVPMITRNPSTDIGIIRMIFLIWGCLRRDRGGSEAGAQPSAR